MERTFTPKSKIPTAVDTVLSGHTNAVTAVRWHPQYGHLLASSSLDSTMRIWSVFPNKGEMFQLDHSKGVKDVRWSSDGRTRLSGGLDCYVNVVDAEKGVCAHSYKHTESIRSCSLMFRYVTSLCPHPYNPHLFLAGGQRRGIVCWDTRVSSVVCEYFAEFGEVEDLAFLDVPVHIAFSLDQRGFVRLHGGSDETQFYRQGNHRVGFPKCTRMECDELEGAPLSNQVYYESYTCSCVRKHPTEDIFVAQSAANYIALFQSTKPYRMNRRKVSLLTAYKSTSDMEAIR